MNLYTVFQPKAEHRREVNALLDGPAPLASIAAALWDDYYTCAAQLLADNRDRVFELAQNDNPRHRDHNWVRDYALVPMCDGAPSLSVGDVLLVGGSATEQRQAFVVLALGWGQLDERAVKSCERLLHEAGEFGAKGGVR